MMVLETCSSCVARLYRPQDHHHSLKGYSMESVVTVIMVGVIGIVIGMILPVVVRIVWMWCIGSSDYD